MQMSFSGVTVSVQMSTAIIMIMDVLMLFVSMVITKRPNQIYKTKARYQPGGDISAPGLHSLEPA